MNLDLRPQQRLEMRLQLKQILTPLLIQSLRILNLPYNDLVDNVLKESEENVVLDVERQDGLVAYFKDAGLGQRTVRSGDDDGFSSLSRLTAPEASLYDHLMVQLDLEYLEEPDHSIGRELIENINERGFIEDFPELKKTLMEKYNVKENRVKSLLALIQGFEPAGIGARNVKESLLLQIHAHAFDEPELKDALEQIVEDYLEDLAMKDYDKIALELSLDREDVELAADFIEHNLNPAPAEGFSVSRQEYKVLPSFEIKKEGSKYVFVNLEKEKGIKVSFNQKYLAMLESPETDLKTKEFIREKLNKAKKLVDMIRRRQEMLDRIGEIVVDKQKDYFAKGIHYLQPVMQKDLAHTLEVHPSTISRAISTKYVATPLGILPFKYLCPRSFSGMAVERIKYIIKDMIADNPYASDMVVAEQLKVYGVEIKRRTVAKYRSSIKLLSSYKRDKLIKPGPGDQLSTINPPALHTELRRAGDQRLTIND